MFEYGPGPGVIAQYGTRACADHFPAGFEFMDAPNDPDVGLTAVLDMDGANPTQPEPGDYTSTFSATELGLPDDAAYLPLVLEQVP